MLKRYGWRRPRCGWGAFYFWFELLAVCLVLLVAGAARAAGSWTPLAQRAPGSVVLMLSLPDGSVMAADFPSSGGDGKAWYRLTPDSHGSYVNGTWTTLASMHDTRLWYSSQVLRDGRVFVAGGEYGTGKNAGEVYDPVADTWTMCPHAPSGQSLFYDSVSKMLPNGNVLIAPVGPATPGGTVIYDPVGNAWINGPKLVRGYYQDEASWVKLPDDSILTIDPFGMNTERYIPASNTWVDDTPVPLPMYDPVGGELGAAFLLADGRVLYLGGTGHTLYYTPSGTITPGTWTVGPDFPNGLAPDDAGAAMMVNGKILCAAAPEMYLDSNGNPVFPSPTSFFEFDPVANAFNPINGPTGPTVNSACYLVLMLDLPDGSVLYSHFDSQLYVYNPHDAPLAAGKPAITSVTRNADGSYHLAGTLLNGISEGAAYGDDAQMNSNFPLVRLTDDAGNVYYARTHDWTSTGVMTGNTPEATEFNLPAGLPVTFYSLVVIANGISSDPFPFSTVPLFISGQPQGQTALSGDTVAFSVTASGLAPLGYQWQMAGTPLAGATNSTLVLSNVVATQAGDYSVIVSDLSGSIISSNAPLVIVPSVPLPFALDNTNLPLTLNPAARWYGQTNVSHDAIASGRSYFIKDGQQTTLSTTTNGPGTLTFWWKVSSQTNADVLSFSAAGNTFTLSNQISGEVDWNQQTFYLPSGPQALAWTYTKDGSVSDGLDAGFVDQVSYVAGPVSPLILTQPVGRGVFPTQPVTLTVKAGGTAMLAYQWRFDGAALPGATSSSLDLPNPGPADSGLYSVFITNNYGSILSSSAYLGVVPLVATGDDSLDQINISLSTTNAIAIACGAWHSLILRGDGSLVALGDDFEGQCDIPAGLNDVLTIAAGGYHSLAAKLDGTVVAWGANDYGQTNVPAGTSNVIGLAAGTWHSLALRADGTVVAWGDDSEGQCDVPSKLTNVVAIAAGGDHSLALRADGTVVAWGDNYDASGNFAGQSSVPFDLNNVVAIGAGDYHSLAVKADGTVVAWGDDSEGQCDAPGGLVNAVAIVGGSAHTVVLKADSTVAAWGNNWNGQCALPPGATNVVAIAAGNSHTLLLEANRSQPTQLVRPVHSRAQFSLVLQTFAGKNYTLEFKTSFNAANWTPAATLRGSGGFQFLTDPAATSPTRFYRVRQW